MAKLTLILLFMTAGLLHCNMAFPSVDYATVKEDEHSKQNSLGNRMKMWPTWNSMIGIMVKNMKQCCSVIIALLVFILFVKVIRVRKIALLANICIAGVLILQARRKKHGCKHFAGTAQAVLEDAIKEDPQEQHAHKYATMLAKVMGLKPWSNAVMIGTFYILNKYFKKHYLWNNRYEMGKN